MDKEYDPNLPPIASGPYILPRKHQMWVRKELEDMKKAGIIQRSLFPFASPIVIVPRKFPPALPVQETQRFCVDYRKLNALLPLVLGNKSSGVVTLTDSSKIEKCLHTCMIINSFSS